MVIAFVSVRTAGTAEPPKGFTFYRWLIVPSVTAKHSADLPAGNQWNVSICIAPELLLRNEALDVKLHMHVWNILCTHRNKMSTTRDDSSQHHRPYSFFARITSVKNKWLPDCV